MSEISSLPAINSTTTVDPIELVKDTALSTDVVTNTIADQAVSWNSKVITILSSRQTYIYAAMGVIALTLIYLFHNYLLKNAVKQAVQKAINPLNEEMSQLAVKNLQLQEGPLSEEITRLSLKADLLEGANAGNQLEIVELKKKIENKDAEISNRENEIKEQETTLSKERDINRRQAAQLREAQTLFTKLKLETEKYIQSKEKELMTLIELKMAEKDLAIKKQIEQIKEQIQISREKIAQSQASSTPSSV